MISGLNNLVCEGDYNMKHYDLIIRELSKHVCESVTKSGISFMIKCM